MTLWQAVCYSARVMTDDGKIFLPYLFVGLATADFEGRLTLMEGTVTRQILFRAGRPVNVVSNQQEETLGRMLLEEGKLSQDEYRRLLDTMVGSGQRAGEVLVGMGLLQAQEVFSALEFQCRRKLRNCFRMVDFGFTIDKEAVSPESTIINVEIPTVLLDGVPACYSMDRLLGEFPVDEETTFIKRSRAAFQTLTIGPHEQRLLRAIGSGTTLMKLMKDKVGELQELLPMLYVLHALRAIDASGVERPDLSDLELDSRLQPPAAVAAPETTPDEQVEEIEIDLVELEEEEIRPPTMKSLLDRNGIDAQLARKVLALDRLDHFAVLEVEQGAGAEQVKNAYLKLLRQYKLEAIEDSYSSSREQQMARQLLDRLTLAYRLLLDDSKRRQYLTSLADKDKQPAVDKGDNRLLADVEAQKAELAMGSKRYGEAIELFDRAISLYPDEPSYHLRKGQANYFQALEKTPAERPLPEGIRKSFLKVLALDPSHDEARLYLGYISKRDGQLKRALREFESALQCNPHNERAHREVRILKKRLENLPAK